MSKNFLLTMFQCAIVLITLLLVQAQSQAQTGFISIDCGLSETSSYTDETTGLAYISDTNFTDAGENYEITPTHKLITDEKQLWNVRSFPEGTRNCYTLKPMNGSGELYLIRARFMYGNYDNKNSIPSFDLYIGGDLWSSVLLKYSWSIQNEEIMHTPLSDHIHVCLVNTGFGVPFISALELRPLHNETYVSELPATSLLLHERLDFASATNRTTRYKDDVYDRLWSPLKTEVWKPINVSLTDENAISTNIFEPPSAVMSTAYTRNNSISYMGLNWKNLNTSSRYLFFMHFAELKKLKNNQTREFDIFINGNLWFESLAPLYLKQNTIYSSKGKFPDIEGNIQIWFNKTSNSTLPPLVNALEIYVLKEMLQQETEQTDVDAILNIKTVYEVKKNWQGDPCVPVTYVWDGLNCTYNDTYSSSYKITSLDLSSSGLVGEISPYIANLTMLQNLDLSNNSLTGTVPEFLAQLSFLRVLNLKGNNFTGPLPPSLLERINNGLSLRANHSGKEKERIICFGIEHSEMANLFFFLTILKAAIVLTIVAADQSDFISIDCGATEDYNDQITGIKYSRDVYYIDTGEITNISPPFNTENLEQQLNNLRFFPQGQRNCYTLKPRGGKNRTYLIRAKFMYGNYDGLSQNPEFDLYLGVNKWRTVKVENPTKSIEHEIIHVSQSDYISVCLVKTGEGTPFISALELRLMNENTYVSQTGTLDLFARVDCGASSDINQVRFRDDVMDRIWKPLNFQDWNIITNTSSSPEFKQNFYEPPAVVMRTAVAPKNETDVIGISWSTVDQNPEDFYIYLHFAELQKYSKNETRELNIYLNGTLFYGPLVPNYLSLSTIYSVNPTRGSSLQIIVNRTENSTLPPLLNAIEIYTQKILENTETLQNDVDAIMNVKSNYNLKKNWQGDPCEPRNYMWEGLNCSFTNFDSPRIISLNLSSNGLTGQIDSNIFNLTLLEELDLSNNNLTGAVPDFLSQMPTLRVLNLEQNNFSGTLPKGLQEKLKNNSMLLRTDGNSFLCLSSVPCQKKDKDNNKILVPVLASVGGFFGLLSAVVLIFWFLKKRKQDKTVLNVNVESESKKLGEAFELKKHQFTYSEVLSMTTNFARILGKGGFGTVYHGYFKGSQVAVKMLSRSSAQGFTQFRTEAKLLTKVYHRNLTALVGYCDEGPNMGLVYEYMPNGDLAWHLSDKNEDPLSWEERLEIALAAAQGLEYLHCGCKPPIIHRDVKTTNILLDEKLQAKLSDFGLSRSFALEDDTHVSTLVVGTPGYVDPEYLISNRLTEKSDVFSFGVALLEIITGRQAIFKSNGKEHIIEWTKFCLSKGDIKYIMDPRLEQDFNKNSAWKTAEVAMACVSPTSTRRPNMSQIVAELKQCLAMQVARTNNNINAIESIELMENMHVDIDSGPLPR
uniref:non-specific serine/threonine protein kinase n=1 Tax=Cannabis sativa TaxID=3483 RepID=A0A803NZA6_CANSA